MKLFLGDKKEIGVEIEITEKLDDGSLMGYARLWLGQNFVGTIYEYIYLDGYLLGGLYQMLNVKEISDETFPVDKEGQYLYFEKKAMDLYDDESDNYRLNFGTMADCFIIWACRENDFLKIVWKKEVKASCLLYDDLLDYRNDVFGFCIKYDRFQRFVARLDRVLKNW